MKQVTPNVTQLLTARYISSLARLRKFKRVWGTEIVAGEEVFTWRKHYYPTWDMSVRRLAEMLGIWEQIRGRQDGIRSAWFYLNPKKAGVSISWPNELIANNLNIALAHALGVTVEDLMPPPPPPDPLPPPDTSAPPTLTIDKVFNGAVVVGPKLLKRIQFPVELVAPDNDEEAVFAEIKARYQEFWDDNHSFYTSTDDSYLSLLLMFLLYSEDVPYTVTGVEKSVSTLFLPRNDTLAGIPSVNQVNTWRIRVAIPKFYFTPESDIVQRIRASLDGTKIADLLARQFIHASGVPMTAEDGWGTADQPPAYEQPATSSAGYWLVVDGKSYLRTSIMTDPSMKIQDKIDYLFGCIDTGYKKTKLGVMEIIIVVVLVVVSIWYGGVAGVAAAAAFSGTMATVVMVAVAITVAAMYISLAALAASYMGAQNVASALGSVLKTIAPLVQIASVIAIVASLYTAIQRGLQQAAAAAAQQGVQLGMREIAISVVKSILQGFGVVTNLTDMNMSQVTKTIGLVVDLQNQRNARDLQREVKLYRSTLAEMDQLSEKSKCSDILKEIQYSYANVLAADKSFYDEIYDRPYEWWATPYHTGNIQATTVNALWLTETNNVIL